MATRWFQLGTFSPINRLHSTKDLFAGKEPWKYAAPARAAMGESLRLRHRLIPYLFTMAERAHRLGEPLVRPLYHLDPRPETLEAPNTYAFGSELLVAAITSPADRRTTLAEVTAWLPAGDWIDFFTGLRYGGGRTVQLHRPLDGYPVLARAGAIVPLADQLGTGNPESLELHVFAGADGDFTLYEDDDLAEPRSVTTGYRYDHAAGELRIEPASGALDLVPEVRSYRVILRGLDGVGAADAEGTVLAAETATGTLVVELSVPTSVGAVIRFTGERRTSDNRVEARIHDLLAAAQVEYPLKGRIWAMLQQETDTPRRVSALQVMNLEPALNAALCELLLA
jgi:hypothetical protein